MDQGRNECQMPDPLGLPLGRFSTTDFWREKNRATKERLSTWRSIGHRSTAGRNALAQAFYLECQPHSSSALHGAAAVKTVTLGRGVAVSLPWSWSRQPQGRA